MSNKFLKMSQIVFKTQEVQPQTVMNTDTDYEVRTQDTV